MLPWLFRGLVVALLAYEAVALHTPAAGDTISELTWGAVDQYPVLAFLGGLLAGHLFWPRR